MNKMLIGSFVGALILFIWQFLSWGLLNLHGSQMSYSPNQENIIPCISEHLTEEGTYFIPRADPSLSAADQEAFSKSQIGKPWAIVSYRKSFENTFGMNLIRGFVIDFVSVLMLIWILMKFEQNDMKTSIITAVFVGLIGYFYISYLNSIWFQTDSIPDLIDAIVQWAICGAWLGYFLNRK